MVTFEGKPGCISDEQDWKIHPSYLEAHYDQNTDGETVICRCSYPYFSSLKTHINRYGEPAEYWQPITCLWEDNGRDIDTCPNCGCSLIEEEDDDLYVPESCRGCCNYHGETYEENLLVCAMHPYGWEDDVCPDYTAS